MKTMQSIQIICFYVLPLPSLLIGQNHQSIVPIDTVEITDGAYARFSDIKLSHNWDGLQLSFDTITEDQFNSFKNLYTQQIDTSTISLGECPFQLIAADTAFVFRCGVGYYHGYQGYYPTLDSYLVIASGNEVGTAFLIERSTAMGMDIGGANLVISPNNEQILIYDTDVYTDESHMSLVGISNVKLLSDFNSKTSETFYTKDWGIDQLVWINNNSIALKITMGRGQPRKPIIVKYLKAKIQEKNTGANKK